MFTFLFPAASQQLMTELMTELKVCLNCCLSLTGNFPGSVKVVQQFVTGLDWTDQELTGDHGWLLRVTFNKWRSLTVAAD